MKANKEYKFRNRQVADPRVKTNSRVQEPDAKGIEPMAQPPLDKANFVLMAIAAVIIIVGFLLMMGSGSTRESFNPDIFSTRRIVVGPTIAFIGFIAMGAAIIYRKK